MPDKVNKQYTPTDKLAFDGSTASTLNKIPYPKEGRSITKVLRCPNCKIAIAAIFNSIQLTIETVINCATHELARLAIAEHQRSCNQIASKSLENARRNHGCDRCDFKAPKRVGFTIALLNLKGLKVQELLENKHTRDKQSPQNNRTSKVDFSKPRSQNSTQFAHC